MLKTYQDTTRHHSLTFRIRSQCIPSFQKVQETDYVEHTDMFVSCCSALSDWDTSRQCLSECEEGAGVCALLMTGLSLFIIILSLPVSLVFVVKVVQVKMFIEVLEYFYYITWNFEISQQPLCSKTDTFYFSCSILWHDDIIREFFARTLNWYERHIFCQ